LSAGDLEFTPAAARGGEPRPAWSQRREESCPVKVPAEKKRLCSRPHNGRVEALGGCGVSTFAKQLTPMRVKKLEKRAD